MRFLVKRPRSMKLIPMKSRIVVLDGHTLNPGDLSWDPLRALGELTVHARTAPGEIAARAAGAAVVLTNKCPLAAATIAVLPELRCIGVLATGHNIVDSAAARARGIVVCNVPTYGTRTVAQATIALLLELANQAGYHAATVAAGRWASSPDWSYWDRPLVELDGLTFGLVGAGRIGQATAAIARALGMRVIVHSRTAPDSIPLDRLFAESDVVSLHCPLTPETKGLVNAARLALMKPSAFLLNTSRGALVDEAALAEALNGGRLAGAALDVLSVEPPPADHPLLSARNCLITPHQAWAARAARARLLAVTVENVRGFLAGRPQNVVN